MNVKVQAGIKSLDLFIWFCFSFVDQLIVNKHVESESKIY